MPASIKYGLRRRKVVTTPVQGSNGSAHGTTLERMDIGQKKGWSGFSDVDRSSDALSLVRYLDKANSNEVVRFSKWQLIHRILCPQKGDSILDVGCGPGHDIHILATLVGKNGRIVGVDKSEIVIREAIKRCHGLTIPVGFQVGDIHQLDFPDDSFDRCLVASTLMYVDTPLKAIREIVRVLKPGGRLAVLEGDRDTLVMSIGNTVVTDRVIGLIRQSLRNSGIGHELPILFRQAGLKQIDVEAVALAISDYRLASDAWRSRPP